MTAPSPRAYVPFVSVAQMMRLVHEIGIEPFLAGLAERIEAEFLRWEAFDKTPRVAAHPPRG